LKAKEPRDRSASVRARLLNLARERGEDFQITLRNYLFERFLYRLGRSELRERFVLKGAMLLRLWADQPYRATVDLDLLSQGNPDPDSRTSGKWQRSTLAPHTNRRGAMSMRPTLDSYAYR
jgi:hypothetical protein